MTPEAQRIAIAEACGTHTVTRNEFSEGVVVCVTDKNGRTLAVCNYTDGHIKENHPTEWIRPLDYLNDLNAMHEAVMTLDAPSLCKYRCHLARNFTDHSDDGLAMAIDATAAQRAEAFLRTIGKWEGES